MKVSVLQSITLVTLLSCCSAIRADGGEGPASRSIEAAARMVTLPTDSGVVVMQVSGKVEYAYDSTGWRILSDGKRLQPGARVRAAKGATAVLRVSETSFLKVSPATSVQIVNETPAEERSTVKLAADGRTK